MADTLGKILVAMARGMLDSLGGAVKIYHLRKEKTDSESEEKLRRSKEFSTVLAQRRAQQGRARQTTKEQSKEPKILQRIFYCCLFNGGIFLMSILLFRWILMPYLEWFTRLLFGNSAAHSHIWTYMGPTLTWTFNTLWILPLFVLSKIVNTLWFQDIADTAYKKARGLPQLPSISKLIADIVFNLCIQTIFLIQGMLCNYLPIQGLGQFVYLLHTSFLYSLYAFEYKWFNMGWEVQQRLEYVEGNWPYFTGFGLPLAVLTALTQSYVISGCIFSLLFPLFIISANEAKPLENSCTFPLRLFAFAGQLTNKVFLLIKRLRRPKSKEINK